MSPSKTFRLWSIASRALLAVSALAAVLAVASFLRPEELAAVPGEDWVRVAPLDSLDLGSARLVMQGVRPVYVVRIDDRRLVAVDAACTHLRCILRWDRASRTFVCPCHGDRWALGGAVLHGPGTKPLATYTVSVRAGEVWVHK